jgi:hypothetical protein
MLLNRLHTVFGWTVRVGPDANPQSLRDFPCQANGAEMMRLACCLATERGVNVVAPVHDALMIEGPADAIDEIVARTQEAWRRRRPLSWTVSGSGSTPALFGGPIGTWMIGAESFGAEFWR